MKKLKTLNAVIYECSSCGESFKSTNDERKNCALCGEKSIKKVDRSTIVANVEVGDEDEN